MKVGNDSKYQSIEGGYFGNDPKYFCNGTQKTGYFGNCTSNGQILSFSSYFKVLDALFGVPERADKLNSTTQTG